MLVLKTTNDILHRLDTITLKKLCILVGIKTRIRQNKKLVNILIFHYSATKIQRVFRSKLMKYNICPITHELLRYPFISIRHPNGHFNYYSLDGIGRWFRKDKDYMCPNTRYKISPQKLRDIDYIYFFYYKKKLIKEQKPKNNDANNRDLTWVGRDLIVFVKSLDSVNYLSLNKINQVVIPYILNNLYFIFSRNPEYAMVLLSIIINIIPILSLEHGQYILNQIKEVI